ncbi:DNA translocase FtsK 4TM domain-containing protein [Xanthobacter tagetidis]|uniref:DNA translocase FtsK 4TM region domain-containing protein n=2 Tax=Xanthobacter tagetidis TaxID=60216 RepID=A0A3L6ZU66_9HYPH|nr:DNA translocase FtsK 4TM domain-containing protein [Xanthobacter tagetidis]RLP71533.1 hypothetical protein D9R14_22490 [Xanthobacter tagetidis]
MARRPAADAVMHSRLEGRADPLHVPHLGLVPDGLKQAVRRRSREIIGAGLLAAGMLAMVALVTWSASDPSLSNATGGTVKNLLGRPGAVVADMLMQLFGLACIAIVAPLLVWGWGMLTHRPFSRARLRLAAWTLGVIGVCAFLSAMPRLGAWPTPAGLGGVIGDLFPRAAAVLRGGWGDPMDGILIAAAGLALALGGLFFALSGGRRTPLGVNGAHEDDEDADDGTSISLGAITHTFLSLKARLFPGRRLPRIAMGGVGAFAKEMFASERPAADTRSRMEPSLAGRRAAPAPQGDADDDGDYDAPPPRSGVPGARKRTSPWRRRRPRPWRCAAGGGRGTGAPSATGRCE